LHRTFTEQGLAADETKLQALHNVLTAYVRRNPTVGYCQGLNFVAAHLLSYLDQEQAFWCLCCLIESILPIDYYTIMIGLIIDQNLFRRLIQLAAVIWDRLMLKGSKMLFKAGLAILMLISNDLVHCKEFGKDVAT
jgi:hypothetical protein